jgi:uncharacterized protein (DUF1800 family)
MAIMARKSGDRLDAAMAQLIENQAAFVSTMAEMRREFEEIRSLLLHHQRILENLPETILKGTSEAIKRTIGFKNK